ncbi:MAG TPA: hypothetical protein VFZ21_30085 [Gemmatimonadaceae bacterium]|nr:hypothetical protein [Gemmatimonadaceae bacterium]
MRLPAPAIVISAIVVAVACHDGTPPTSPDVGGAGGAFSQSRTETNKTAVCHAAGRVDDPRFVEVSVAGGAAAAHLIQHEGDYPVTPRTPCPPPPTTGPNVRICKATDSEFLHGRFYEFDVSGEPVSIRTETCEHRTFRVGTPVTITEDIPTGSQLHSITITPPTAGTANVPAATANILAGIDVTEVMFTNSAVSGQLAICKQVEPVGLVGRHFPFFVDVFGATGTSHPGLFFFVTPTSVGSPPGTCVPAGSYPLGTRVRVREEMNYGSLWFGIETIAITVDPADRLVPGSLNLFGRNVTATIGEGTTQVRFVNARQLGELQICTVSPPGFSGTTRFNLVTGWSDGPVPPVDVPANGCAPVVETGLGWPGVLAGAPMQIAQVIPAGQRVTAITVAPSDVPVDPGNPASGVVGLEPGPGTTTVTFYNAWAP